MIRQCSSNNARTSTLAHQQCVCGPFTRHNVAGFDSGTSSTTPRATQSSVQRDTWSELQGRSTWQPSGMGKQRACTYWGSHPLPRPADPQVRSSRMLGRDLVTLPLGTSGFTFHGACSLTVASESPLQIFEKKLPSMSSLLSNKLICEWEMRLRGVPREV